MAYFLSVLRALNDAGVDYVIVGGVATVLHGHLRFTANVNLIIRMDRDNVLLTLEALKLRGLVPRQPVDPQDFADPVRRRAWVTQQGMMVFSFFDPTNAATGVDLFADDTRDFAGLYARSDIKQLGDTPVRVCALDDLIAMKSLTGRSIDEQDVEALTLIQQHGSE